MYCLLARSSHFTTSYSPFVLYAFTLNYILGVGCLALPYAMYRVGIVTGVIVLAFVALMTYITVNWIIECSWRANHMEASHLPTLTPLSPPTTSNNTTTYRSPYHQSTLQFFVTPRIQHVLRSNSFKKYGAMNVQNGYEEEEEQHDMNVWMNEQSPTHSSHDGSRPTSSRLRNRILPSHPDSSYTLKQKYEIVQLTELFLGRTYRNIYQCGLCFLMVTGLWAYTTVFLTSVVGKLSFLCSSSSSDHCTLSYALVALLFALIVVPLSCMDLTDQISVQVTLTLVRFVSLGLMIGSAAWGMWYDYTDSGVNTMHTMEQPALLPSPPYAAFTSFHPHSLGLMFTTAVFSHLFQHSVPGLIAPLKNKRSIPYVMIATLLTTFLLYATLSSVCGMYFGSKTLPSINLNWKTFHWGYSDTSSLPVWCHILNYTIVLFPAIDTVSVFPLIAITLGNSLRATVGTRRGNR